MITEQTIQQIIDDYNRNDKIADIAVRHGISKQAVLTTIRSARSEGRVTRAPRSVRSDIAPGRDNRMVEMYQSGMTLTAIGDEFGLTRERVRQILNSKGVSRRTASAYASINREAKLGQYTEMIDQTFNEVRSIPRVVRKLKGIGIPSRWVEQYLAPRRSETLRTHSMPQVWTNDQILAVLKAAAGGADTISIPSYQKWRTGALFGGRKPPTHSLIAWRFGSWANAVNSAGLVGRKPYRTYSRKWDANDAYGAVRRYVDEMSATGQRPTFDGYDAWSRGRGEVPSGAYIRILTNKSWSEILRSVTTPA